MQKGVHATTQVRLRTMVAQDTKVELKWALCMRTQLVQFSFKSRSDDDARLSFSRKIDKKN